MEPNDFIGIGVIVVLLVVCYFLYQITVLLKEWIRFQKESKKPAKVERELQAGKFDEVIERCLSDLEEFPMYVEARWYLAVAYYGKKMWKESKAELEKVAKLNPSWRGSSLDDYIKATEENLAEEQEQSSL